MLGIGLLIALAAFDNALDAFMQTRFGISTGLTLSGTIATLVLAYALRFLAIFFGSLESGLEQITPTFAAATRTLGRTALRTPIEIQFPILEPALSSATLLVFVDGMKKLPAALILRPLSFEILATFVFVLVLLDQLEASAAPTLTIVAAGLVSVVLLARQLQGLEFRNVAV